MTDQRPTIRALTAALLLAAAFPLAAGCGGEDEETGSEEAAKATPTATVSSAIRKVTASVDGRELSGHCSGTQEDSPAVLLDGGMGGGQRQLSNIEQRFAERTLVCAYDRAGVGASDPPADTPRRVSELVADLDAFAAAADARAPYLLVGQSMGANVVFMYAQAHPEKVAGFVSMNPVPPSETFFAAAKEVETTSEFAEERSFYRGKNEENTSFQEPTLNHPLPASMPYMVMFDEDCGGDSEFCSRILPSLIRSTKSLAAVGDGGRFVRAKGAGHEIFAADPELVYETIDEVLNDAK